MVYICRTINYIHGGGLMACGKCILTIEGIGGGPLAMEIAADERDANGALIMIGGLAVPVKFADNGQDVAEIWLNRQLYGKLCCAVNFRVRSNGVFFEFVFAASECAEMTVKDSCGKIVAKIYVDDQLPPEAVIPGCFKRLILN